MNNRTAIAALALTLVMGVCAPSLYSAGREMLAPPAAPVIATINIEKVFNGLEERAEMKREFDETKARLEAELEADLAKIKTEQSMIEVLTTDAEKTAKAEAVATMGGQIKIKQELFNARIERKQQQMYIALYEKIAKATKKLAEDRKINLILNSDDSQPLPKYNERGEPIRSSDVMRFIALKRVYYSDPALDVSDDLITLMNNQYKAGK